MRFRSILLVAVLAAPACWSTELLPGRCDQTSDCAPGFRCNLDPTPQGNGRCVPLDDGGTPDGAAGAPEASAGMGGSTGIDGGAGAGGSDAKPGCTSSAACPASSPICGADGNCVACNAAGLASTACSQIDPTKPVCTSSGTCAQCETSANCRTDPTKPVCGSAGVCLGCNAVNVGQGACMQLDPTHPACASTGACVACATSANCTTDPTKPICDVANQVCVACTSDSQCMAKLGMNPAVCMAHQNGRCATDAETFYVVNQAGCDDGGMGTAATPFCSMEPAAKQAGGSRSVIVVRGPVLAAMSNIGGTNEVSLVGQLSASLTSALGPTGLHVATGKAFYGRSVTITAVNGIGVLAEPGSTVKLDGVTVSNSAKGGIQLSMAAFDIKNSTITGNGPGSDGTFFWGGIDVQFPPAGGPATLSSVTVSGNKSLGIACTGAVSATNVLVMGNPGGDVAPSCAFNSCAAAGPTCGAQQ